MEKLQLKTDEKMNIILASDAYKMSHWKLYPENTEIVYSYLESRGGKFPGMIFFGLQIYLKKYLEGVVVSQWMIDEAEKFCEKMFGTNYFNRDGWQRIVDVHKGKLPIRIKAVPEGMYVPTHNVLLTMENTDRQLPWITSFLETVLFQCEWYGSTVATTSFFIKRLIAQYAKEAGEEASPFHLNDFGFRGVSSMESAGIGGAAHLVNFLGTDTLNGIQYAMNYYDADVCGFSVAASEHSVTCLHKKENEIDAYRHFLKSVPTGLLSVVSDTYDYYFTVSNIFGTILKDDILAREGKFVVRPDSGNPPEVALWTLKTLYEKFGGTINEKGFKVLNPKVGVIYGDGIDFEMINKILRTITQHQFAVSNIVFGMGGGLLQKVDRDVQKMAFKASYGVVDGQPRAVKKETKADPSKVSKAGMLKLIDLDGKLVTVKQGEHTECPDLLQAVFEDGEIKRTWTFDEVRTRANQEAEKDHL